MGPGGTGAAEWGPYDHSPLTPTVVRQVLVGWSKGVLVRMIFLLESAKSLEQMPNVARSLEHGAQRLFLKCFVVPVPL